MTKRQQQLDDNTAEIYNTLTSDLMTENPDVSQSNLGPGKKIAYSYKGMTESEKMQIRQEQLQQVEEARVRILNPRKNNVKKKKFQKRKELENRSQREFDDYMDGTQKSIYLMDIEIQRKQR